MVVLCGWQRLYFANFSLIVLCFGIVLLFVADVTGCMIVNSVVLFCFFLYVRILRSGVVVYCLCSYFVWLGGLDLLLLLACCAGC